MLTSTFLTSGIVSQNLDKQSPLQLITTAIPSGTSNKIGQDLTKKVFWCERYVHLIKEINYHPEHLNVYLLDIQVQRKVTRVIFLLVKELSYPRMLASMKCICSI